MWWEHLEWQYGHLYVLMVEIQVKNSLLKKLIIRTNSVPLMTPVFNSFTKISIHIYLQIHRWCLRYCLVIIITNCSGLSAPEIPGTKPQRENFYRRAAGTSIPSAKATSLTWTRYIHANTHSSCCWPRDTDLITIHLFQNVHVTTIWRRS